ncbi:hypothetical protein BC936DRAFT_137473 [Jimgerdemannia flammicorona]|uniref:Uncharacterized protein n=1 Tax=Jimgerdemannia flammicorona TaxID=994334 RepID=A0A433CXA6_9FUNG|nr:hypothetical protein BC936DRAFT_137473 [Jimgerdemannia flammicorona]
MIQSHLLDVPLPPNPKPSSLPSCFKLEPRCRRPCEARLWSAVPQRVCPHKEIRQPPSSVSLDAVGVAMAEQPTPHHPQSITKPSTQPTAIVPLYSFERADDYVTSSGRPHTGAVDGGGKFDLWNLNADTEVYV